MFGRDRETVDVAYPGDIVGLVNASALRPGDTLYADGAAVTFPPMAPATTCQPSHGQRLRMLPTVAGLGPLTAARVVAWTSAWTNRDPDEPHIHLGPLAVDRHLQGRGIGSLIMAEVIKRLDEAGAVGYLETDRAVNVSFYERFGFEVAEQAQVLRVTNWFMRRAPSAPAS